MTRRLPLLLALYISALFAAAVGFDLPEGRDMWSSAWWAMVAATTVDYGDLSPTTVGRVVIIFVMHLTTLLVLPLIGAKIAARLIVDIDAFAHDEQEEIKLALRRLEAKLDRLVGGSSAPAGAVVGHQPPGSR